MANFCTKCGKKLEDGKECKCQTEREKDALTESKIIVRNYINLFLEIMKGIVKTPIDIIKKYSVENNFGFGIVAILLNSIVSGLFFYCFLKEGTSALSYNLFMIRAEVPFMKTLLVGVLFVAVGFAVTIAMIYILASSLFKLKVDFKTITAMVATCSVLTTVTTLISMIAIFISINLALFILIVASLFYMTYLCQGIIEITNVSKNKLAYVFVTTVCVTFFVVVYILPKILF